MKYFYYPGCTLEGTAREYDLSTRKTLQALGAELLEIRDWTCCGAGAGETEGHLLALVLAARNLALAEQSDASGQVLVPCSACYLNLRRVEDHVQRQEGLKNKINEALKEEKLEYQGKLKIRHLLDVLATDCKPEDIAKHVKQKLTGLKVVPYYGCQALRPYADFDDPQQPASMEPIIGALGAEVYPWTMGAKCCGAALMSTKKKMALELVGGLLKAAKGADCIVTVCPMCQMNLEAYQQEAAKTRSEDLSISVVYLPQLMGLALGLDKNELKLSLNLVLKNSFKEKVGI